MEQVLPEAIFELFEAHAPPLVYFLRVGAWDGDGLVLDLIELVRVVCMLPERQAGSDNSTHTCLAWDCPWWLSSEKTSPCVSLSHMGSLRRRDAAVVVL